MIKNLAILEITLIKRLNYNPEIMAKKLISCKSLCVSDNNTSILEDITFDIFKGEIITVIGPNGSGKTTLMKLLCGISKDYKGTITKDKNLTIGYVPQKMNSDKIFPLTVNRFISLRRKVVLESRRNIIDEIIKEMGIERLFSKQISSLSGGEVQKVMLARAIMSNPDLLVLDEPLQGLDVIGQAEFYKLIDQIRGRLECSVLMVSHDLHMVMASTDKVICINHHICCQGKPEDVSKHPEYINLFGSKHASNVAVYNHKHNHSH